MAVNKNDMNLDSSDYYDPTDSIYNSTLQLVLNRENYTPLTPIIPNPTNPTSTTNNPTLTGSTVFTSSSSPIIADKVEGVSWMNHILR